MCCGKAFWKRFLVFGLTFGFGVLISSAFMPKECTAPPVNQLPLMKPSPAQSSTQTAVPSPLENKNCVPLDGKLKYETLENKEQPGAFRLDKTPKSEAVRPEDKKKSSKNKKEYERTSKNSVEVRDLLHREKCFESPERK